jgi:apolipoprotein N-acyltransferase
VPFRGAIPFLESFQLPGGDLTPADQTNAIEVGGIVVGPLLCFEAQFVDVAVDQARNGAQLLAAMVIDDWYMGTVAPAQLRMAGVWRAVEAALPLVRVGPLGYTEYVDARGNLIARAKLGETTALRCEVLLPDGPQYFPPIVAFPWLFGASCLAPASLLWIRTRRPASN